MNTKLVLACALTVALIPLSSGVLAAGDAAAGQGKSTTCAGCHGANGEGIAPKTKISGMNVGAFKKAMDDYKTGTRKHAMMEMFAKQLSDQDVADLAAFYATK